MKLAIITFAVALLPAWAQEIKLPDLDKLAAKADETVTVTMDKSMLKLAMRFLEKEGEDAEVRKLVAELDSVYVRSFEFGQEGAYDKADVESLRGQFQGPAWGRIVGVRSKRTGEDADVYFKQGANGQIGGIVVISAEPRELTVVQIIGNIDPDHLAELGGEFGVPRLDTSRMRREAQ